MPCEHCHMPLLLELPHGSHADFCMCLACLNCGRLLDPEQDDPAPCETCHQCEDCCHCPEEKGREQE